MQGRSRCLMIPDIRCGLGGEITSVYALFRDSPDSSPRTLAIPLALPRLRSDRCPDQQRKLLADSAAPCRRSQARASTAFRAPFAWRIPIDPNHRKKPASGGHDARWQIKRCARSSDRFPAVRGSVPLKTVEALAHVRRTRGHVDARRRTIANIASAFQCRYQRFSNRPTSKPLQRRSAARSPAPLADATSKRSTAPINSTGSSCGVGVTALAAMLAADSSPAYVPLFLALVQNTFLVIRLCSNSPHQPLRFHPAHTNTH